MSALERRLFPHAGEKKGKKKGVSPALARAVCLLLTFFLLALIVLLLVLVVVEGHGQKEHGPQYHCLHALTGDKAGKHLVAEGPEITSRLENLSINWAELAKNLWDFLTTGVGSVVSSTISATMRVFGAVSSGFISFIFAIYLLLQKERLGLQRQRWESAPSPR